MSGPHLVILKRSGFGWRLLTFYRRHPWSHSRCHTSWYRERVDACVSLREVMR